jgi:hypothetical protein
MFSTCIAAGALLPGRLKLFYLRVTILCLLASCSIAPAGSAPSTPDPAASSSATPAAPWTEILERYLSANQEQQSLLRDSTMDIDIEARLPRMKKVASAHGIRQITRLGQITYQAVRSVGDKMVSKDVIARYLKTEEEASNGIVAGNGKLDSIAISPENYKFKYKGASTINDRRVHVFQVSPRKKRIGLFKGEVWVDAETYLPFREMGRLVRNPSVFLKKVEFLREYDIQAGRAFPVRIESRVDTRLVGMAELYIRFSNFSPAQTAQLRICALGW